MTKSDDYNIPGNTDEEQRAVLKIQSIHKNALVEARILDEVAEERKRTISTLVGNAWKAKTFPDTFKSKIDPLLTKKFKTRVGLSSVRLEKLLLELDKVETHGNEEIRAKRKEEVKYLQTLLQKADELNVKATQLVGFQERVEALGNYALRTTLEAGDKAFQTDANAMDEQEESPRKRRFASEEREEELDKIFETKQEDSAESMDVEKVETPVSDEVIIEDKDSVDDLRMVQEDMDRKAEEFYLGSVQPQTTEYKPDEGESEKPVQGSESPRSSKPKEPRVSIQELPRAFVVTVQDANIGRAKVSIDNNSVLNVVVPGRSPVRFSLGSNINLTAVTKEVRANTLEIILPKLLSSPMRTGRSFGEGASPWSGRRRGDFWSRF